jgi:DNA-binding response OmpR family regulator
VALILLVDDDPSLVDVLGMAITDAGHELVTAGDGLAALASVAARCPDIVISDVNMPKLDGFALCKKLRDAKNDVPIVLLTSRDSEIDEALGLELGADDYVAKPFSTRVLLARVTALLRRDALRRRAEPDREIVSAGALALDPERLEATFRGTMLTLTLTEFRLLEAMARRPGIVLSRERLLEIVRGDESVVVERIVDTYVRRLRRKLEAIDPAFEGIETVVGAGYRLRATP